VVTALALTPIDFFSKIGFHPVALVAVVAAWTAYESGVRRLARRNRSWPQARRASFATAMVIIAAATLSGLASYLHTSFSVTAVDELGLFMIAPVFLCLSAPLTLAIESSRPATGTRILDLVRGLPGQVLYNPAFSWAVFASSLYLLFFSGQYRAMVAHPWVLDLTDLELVVVGCIFLWPVIGADPRPRRLAIGWRMLYVLVCTVYYSVLGLAMESQRTPIAPGLAVSDLHTGGGVLWSTGELLTIAMSIGILLQWLAIDEGHARRADDRNAEEDARQLARWRAERRVAGLADVRARESVIVRSRPAGTASSDATAIAARRAGPRPSSPEDPDRAPDDRPGG
jgi:cytochrome c oxidase assembly factor CtaG